MEDDGDGDGGLVEDWGLDVDVIELQRDVFESRGERGNKSRNRWRIGMGSPPPENVSDTSETTSRDQSSTTGDSSPVDVAAP